MLVNKKIIIVVVILVFIACGVYLWQKTKVDSSKEILAADYRNDCSNFISPGVPDSIGSSEDIQVDPISYDIGDVKVSYLDMKDNTYKYVLLNYMKDFSNCSPDAKRLLTNILEMKEQRH